MALYVRYVVTNYCLYTLYEYLQMFQLPLLFVLAFKVCSDRYTRKVLTHLEIALNSCHWHLFRFNYKLRTGFVLAYMSTYQ